MASNAKSRGFRLLSFAAKWALATALAWLLSLLLFSTQPYMPDSPFGEMFGPAMKRESWTMVVLFFVLAGFLSSASQWWLLRRGLAHAQWWIAVTTAGALAGAVFLRLMYETPPIEVSWYAYPLATALPVSILQGAFLIWRTAVGQCPRKIKLAGGAWAAVRPVLLALTVLVGVLLSGIFPSLAFSPFSDLTTLVIYAVGYTLLIGLPFGLLSGMYLQPIFTGLAKSETMTLQPSQ